MSFESVCRRQCVSRLWTYRARAGKPHVCSSTVSTLDHRDHIGSLETYRRYFVKKTRIRCPRLPTRTRCGSSKSRSGPFPRSPRQFPFGHASRIHVKNAAVSRDCLVWGTRRDSRGSDETRARSSPSPPLVSLSLERERERETAVRGRTTRERLSLGRCRA